MIFVGNDREIFGALVRYHQVAGASGSVTVSVPKGQRVLFEANRRVFENPSCLDDVSPQGIDVLKIGLISLDDSEDGMCDKALAHAAHFQGIEEVEVDHSEATDSGLSKLRTLSSLQGISCYSSSIKGYCFRDLAMLPALKALWASHCDLVQENLKYLKDFPKLQVLNLDKTHLDSTGSKYLSFCRNLIELSVRGNQKFDDNCLLSLAALKDLSVLDVRETSVTAQGLKQLRGLKLQKLLLPNLLKNNIAELQTIFPRALISADSSTKSVGEESRALYAPLK
jgi:hypothetical protein